MNNRDGHAKVSFTNWNPRLTGLTEQDVRDLVDVLFRFEGKLSFSGVMRPKEKKTLNGLHCYDSFFDLHEIYINPDQIRRCVSSGRRAGGNRVVTDFRLAVGMVLAHEIQHGNQHHVHESHHRSFFGKDRSRYLTRPCEREARQFADDSIPQIAAVLGIEQPRGAAVHVPQDELEGVVDLLVGVDKPTRDDLTEELRLSGLNNPLAFGRAVEMLRSRGVLLS